MAGACESPALCIGASECDIRRNREPAEVWRRLQSNAITGEHDRAVCTSRRPPFSTSSSLLPTELLVGRWFAQLLTTPRL